MGLGVRILNSPSGTANNVMGDREIRAWTMLCFGVGARLFFGLRMLGCDLGWQKPRWTTNFVNGDKLEFSLRNLACGSTLLADLGALLEKYWGRAGYGLRCLASLNGDSSNEFEQLLVHVKKFHNS